VIQDTFYVLKTPTLAGLVLAAHGFFFIATPKYDVLMQGKEPGRSGAGIMMRKSNPLVKQGRKCACCAISEH
jgi:hypothetical protein